MVKTDKDIQGRLVEILERVLRSMPDNYTDYLHPALATRVNNYRTQMDQPFFPDNAIGTLPAPSHAGPLHCHDITQDMWADPAPLIQQAPTPMLAPVDFRVDAMLMVLIQIRKFGPVPIHPE